MLYVNKAMQKAPMPIMEQRYVPSGKKERVFWKYEENQSASVYDPIFQQIESEEGSPLERSEEAIKNHLEERISAFLLQLIDCYNTPLYFTVGKTENQAESTARRKIDGVTCEFAAAHHGTLPCIYSYPRDEWLAWKEQNNPRAPGKPKGMVFMKNSDTYFAGNACTGLLKKVNQADIDLDGNPTERGIEFGAPQEDHKKKLRAYSVDLLNKCAQQEISPLLAFTLFLVKLETLVTSELNNTKDDEKELIFAFWNEALVALRNRFHADPKAFVSSMLGIEDLADHPKVAERFFPIYFKLLQKKNLYQNQLHAEVDELARSILSSAPKKPVKFDLALKVAILERAAYANEKVRSLFQRYYNSSGQDVQKLRLECYKPALRLVSTKENQSKIQEMIGRFSSYVRNFTIDESRFRSELLTQIRKIKGFSLRTFAEKHNELYPQTTTWLNHEQLRRIEGGAVMTDPKMMERFAAVLEVSKKIFETGFSTAID